SAANNFNKIAVEEMPVQKLQALKDIAHEALSAGLPAASVTNFKAFERTVPVASPHIATAVPDWAKGAKIDHTIGPFVDANGIKRWYDFYPVFIQQQVKIFVADTNQPLLILTVFESIFFPRNQLKYALVPGSLWIAAKSLSNEVNTGDAYCGLKIKGGSISFSKVPVPVGKDFQIDAATQVTLTIQPDPNAVSGSDPSTGLDATKAQLSYFPQVVFQFTNGAGKITGNAPGKIKVYGSGVGLGDYDAAGQITYSTNLGGIFIPFKTTATAFSFTTVLSTFCLPGGGGQIVEAGWFLPVSLTSAGQLGAAGGTGSLGFAVSKGASIQWQGLQNGPFAFNLFILLAEPGLISIIGAVIKNPLTSEKFILWEEDIAKKRFSTFTLAFLSSVELNYTVSSLGIELINATVTALADMDRPIAANGTRIQLKPQQAAFVLVDIKNIREVILYDFNLAQEQIHQQLAPLSIDLRNAFFIVTQPQAFILAGVLSDDVNISKGNLGILFGVKNAFLTLPDPYVSNQLFNPASLYRGPGVAGNIAAAGSGNALLLLMSFVTWQKQDAPALDFKIAPLSQQELLTFLQTFLLEEIQAVAADAPVANAPTALKTAAALKPNATEAAAISFSDKFKALLSASPVIGSIVKSPGSRLPQVPESELATKAVMDAYGSVYTRLLESLLQPGQLMLLDVSGNADQLGVSFSYLRDKGNNIAGNIAGGAGAAVQTTMLPFQAQGIDIVASGQYVRAFTLPNNQWEPVKNIPNPDADPPGFPNPIIFP
ncbi:MAG TPA: hypothetical protein VIU45_00580, partial [Chitinophagaceae bacterium]